MFLIKYRICAVQVNTYLRLSIEPEANVSGSIDSWEIVAIHYSASSTSPSF